MKKSLSIQTMFADRLFYERFSLARAAGFDFVEFGDWTDLDFTRVSAELRDNGLRLASIAGSLDHPLDDPDRREDFLEFLSQSIAVAKNFGCGNLIIEPGGEPLAFRAAGGDFTRIAAVTRALMDAAEKARRAGVTLLLKPVSTRRDPRALIHITAAAVEVVKVVNSPDLRLLYDVTQMQAMEGDIIATIRRYRDLIGYVQIGDDCHAADLENGEINLRHFLGVLIDELGYNGIVGFLCSGGAEEEECLESLRSF